MLTKDKVTELFCIENNFCNFFDAMMAKYTLKCPLGHNTREPNTRRAIRMLPNGSLCMSSITKRCILPVG